MGTTSSVDYSWDGCVCIAGFVPQGTYPILAHVFRSLNSAFLLASKFYPAIFPIIKVVLGNATRPDQKVLQCRAMECGGMIALAVGKKTFKPDAPEFTSLLLRIQGPSRATFPERPTLTLVCSKSLRQMMMTRVSNT